MPAAWLNLLTSWLFVSNVVLFIVYVGPVLDTTSRWSNTGELWRRDNKGIISNIFEKYLPERDANINSLDKNSYLFWQNV